MERIAAARHADAAFIHGDHTVPTLALGLRAFPWSQYATELGRNEGRALRARTDEAIVTALEGVVSAFPDLRILPIPMCVNHYGDDDRWYYRTLFADRPTIEARLDWGLLGRELPSDAYLAAYASADAVLAMRFHSLIFGLGCGVPSVAIDYTMGKGKLSALAESSDVPCHVVGNIDPHQLKQDLLTRLVNRRARDKTSPPKFPRIFAEGLAQISPGKTSQHNTEPK